MIFIVTIAVAILAWKFLAYRGLVFIRAFVFLKARADGLSLDEANQAAGFITPHLSIAFRHRAAMYAQGVHQGSQMAVISEAVSEGFAYSGFLDRFYRSLTH